jgi:holin-like protein
MIVDLFTIRAGSGGIRASRRVAAFGARVAIFRQFAGIKKFQEFRRRSKMARISSAMSTINARSIALASRRYLRRSRLLQICLISVTWWIATYGVHLWGLRVPPGIVGMAFVLTLLATRRISLFTLRRGAEWFVGEMMLFFVPAVVSVLDHQEFIGRLGVELLSLIVLSTLAVMRATAMTVELAYRWRTRRERD